MPKPRIKRFADGPEVREWASKLTDEKKKSLNIEGIEVSQRGRFHSDLVRAFNQEHKSQGVAYVPIGRTQPRINAVFEEALDQLEDDKPTVYRQPRQEEVPPTPQPVAAHQPSSVLAFPGAPEPVMEMLRKGANVIVVYVPLQMAAAAV